MQSNGRKNIGVFINKIDEYFQRIIYRSLINRANEYDYNLLIFNSYGNRDHKNAFDNLEGLIVDFAPLKELDGVIVIPDSYRNSVIREKLLKKLKKECDCPVVALRTKNDDFYNVIADETTSIRKIIRHFIYDHHFKKICFLGGPTSLYDAQMRLKCYQEEMEKANLPIYSNYIYHGDFWYTCGKDACDFFFSDPDHIPEAIICANDCMAVSIGNAIKEKGLHIPEDVCISGYDNSAISREYEPPLTTIEVDFSGMAEKSLEIIHDCLNGHIPDRRIYYGKTIECFRESCKCHDKTLKNAKKLDTAMIEQSATLINRQIEYTLYTVEMGGCSSVKDIHDVVCNHINEMVNNYRDFYLCMFEEHETECSQLSYCLPKEASIRIALQNKRIMDIPSISFSTSEILPSYIWEKQPQTYYVTVLHNMDKCFGYTAISFTNDTSFDIFYHSFNVTLAMTINDVYTKAKIHSLMSQIEQQSILDPLTQLYNRRGFEKEIKYLLTNYSEMNGTAAFICLDLDGLKKINDTYGHAEGDFAIRTIANAIIKATPENDSVSARMGGDEFQVVLFSQNDIFYDVNQFVQLYNSNVAYFNEIAQKKYRIEASLGIFTTPVCHNLNYEECMRKSDLELYCNKREKKQKNN